jgi:hypothetical protein
MAKSIKGLLYSIKNKMMQIIAMQLMPKGSSIHKEYIKTNYLKPSRIQQDDVEFNRAVLIEHPHLVIYGNGVEIAGGGKWDARSGIIIGEGSSIGKGVTISTREASGTGVQYGPVIIAPNTVIPSNSSLPPSSTIGDFDYSMLRKKYGQGEGLFFVVSTGRSGSKAITHLLNQHSEIQSYHDSLAHLNIYACDKKYGRKNEEEIAESIQKMFVSLSLPTQKTNGFSDQKLSLLIPEIHSIFPKAKFVWLIRKGDSFVNAAYSRGWYFNREFGYSDNEKEFFHSVVTPSAMDAAHRLNAFKLGILTEAEWKNMTAFERNCWYWTWLNSTIEEDLEKIPREQWIRAGLHELNELSETVQTFLGLEVKSLKANKVNAAGYKKVSKSSWNEEMKNIFELHCGIAMKKWF